MRPSGGSSSTAGIATVGSSTGCAIGASTIVWVRGRTVTGLTRVLTGGSSGNATRAFHHDCRASSASAGATTIPGTRSEPPTCSWIAMTMASSVMPSSVAIEIEVPTGIGAGVST